MNNNLIKDKKHTRRIILTLLTIIFSLQIVYSQNTLQGRIKTADGLDVPHATVKIRGANNSVVADEKGVFKLINVPEVHF